MIRTRAVGGLVVGDKGNVLVVNQNGNSWSLPKGHVDPGETDSETLLREIAEESGIKDVKIVTKLGEYDRYRIGLQGGEDKSEMKHIVIFLCRAVEVDPLPTDPNNPDARWVNPDYVAKLLTHPKDKKFFEEHWPKVKGKI